MYTVYCTLGYSNFNNFILTGRWRLQNQILRLIFTKKCFVFLSRFPPRLTSKFAKAASMTKFFQKCNMGIKKRWILCWFQIRRKNYQRKSYRKLEFFTLIIVCKSFYPINVLGEFWTVFWTVSNSASNFGFYDTHIEFLPKKLFCLYYRSLLTLSQTRIKGLKKTKKVFRIPFTSISGRGGSILSKK